MLDLARKVIDFSLFYQKENGSWGYSINTINHKERNQIDFHQGFIIDSLLDFINFSGNNEEKYMQSVNRGSEFYMNYQFENNGQSIWRLPWSYPIDIHNQAQGIITSSNLYGMFHEPKYLDFAKKISRWTIKNMYDERGFFYYQKWPFFTNKINYMRWGQAWMMLAISILLKELINNNS